LLGEVVESPTKHKRALNACMHTELYIITYRISRWPLREEGGGGGGRRRRKGGKR
jgi:hypothetical protein